MPRIMIKGGVWRNTEVILFLGQKTFHYLEIIVRGVINNNNGSLKLLGFFLYQYIYQSKTSNLAVPSNCMTRRDQLMALWAHSKSSNMNLGAT